MKESSRPVPKQKKRRKIAALAIPGGSQSAAGMDPSSDKDDGNEEEKKEVEVKKNLGSKRNTSKPAQFNIWIMSLSIKFDYPF